MKNKKYIASILCLSLALAVVSAKLYLSEKSSSQNAIVLNPENISINHMFVSEEKALLGKKSYKTNPDHEFGIGWEYLNRDLALNNYKTITFKYSVLKTDPSDDILFVFSIEDTTKNDESKFYTYQAFSTLNSIHKIESSNPNDPWEHFSIPINLVGEFGKTSKTAFYFWNQNKKTVYIDEVSYSLE